MLPTRATSSKSRYIRKSRRQSLFPSTYIPSQVHSRTSTFSTTVFENRKKARSQLPTEVESVQEAEANTDHRDPYDTDDIKPITITRNLYTEKILFTNYGDKRRVGKILD